MRLHLPQLQTGVSLVNVLAALIAGMADAFSLQAGYLQLVPIRLRLKHHPCVSMAVQLYTRLWWAPLQVSGEKQFFAEMVVDAVNSLDSAVMDMSLLGTKKVGMFG